MERRTFVKLAVLFGLNLAFPKYLLAQPEDKELYFLLDSQIGAAYENGNLVTDFPIISGFDGILNEPVGTRLPTPKGTFHILRKSANYINRDGVEMPYSMFFTRSCAIHAWSRDENLPKPRTHRYASHGCISVDIRMARWLFEWAPLGTPVYIWFKRTK